MSAVTLSLLPAELLVVRAALEDRLDALRMMIDNAAASQESEKGPGLMLALQANLNGVEVVLHKVRKA